MGPALLAVLPTLADVGKSLIDRIFPDKIAQETERAKAALELQTLLGSQEIEMYTTQLSAIIAEAQSPDPWTSRARPSFLYVIYVMILASLPLGIFYVFDPIKAKLYIEGVQYWLSAIPDAMWTLFGAGYLGYTGARTWEKNKGVAK